MGSGRTPTITQGATRSRRGVLGRVSRKQSTVQCSAPSAGQRTSTSECGSLQASTLLPVPACAEIPRRTWLLAAAAGAASAAALPTQHAAAALVDEDVAARVFQAASRSVISVIDYRVEGGSEVFEGVGSGFVWDRYGSIVTNYHCIGRLVTDRTGKQRIRVAFGSSDDGTGQVFSATVAGTDAMHDLAVLSVDAPPELLQPLAVGTSADLKVGQSVFAIGSPSGLSRTLTSGIVSGLNRTIPAPTGTRIYGAIQTDASVNGGNSGGPLLDSSGRLVGVNTASFTRSGSGRGSGVNFALPADLVRSTVPNLIVYGTAAGKGV